MPELVTIEAVPILRTGTYELSTGEATFTEEDLKAAVEAFENDPAVKAPRVKIDGLAESFDAKAHGGEPALGWVDGLTVTENGQTLTADWHVPKWLAESMEWAYPSLSIEGKQGWTSATQRRHDLVITAVALLGVDWPGVTTLDDLRSLLENGPEVAAESNLTEVLATMPPEIHAGLDVQMVGRRFVDALRDGDLDLPDGVESQWDLWVTAVRLDDSGKPYLKVINEENGTLYRVDFSATKGDVKFKGFTEVIEQDVPVEASASAHRSRDALASWRSRDEFNASTQREAVVPLDLDALRSRLGLPADADEAAINAALSAPAGEGSGEGEGAAAASAGSGSGEGSGDGASGAGEGQGAGQREPVAASGPASQTHEARGIVQIDASQLQEMQRFMAQAQQNEARRQAEERERIVTAAIGEGRIQPARREHWRRLLDQDPEGTTVLLTASVGDGGLMPNLVPIQPRGHAPGEESDVEAENRSHEAYMQQNFGGILASGQRRRNHSRVLYRTES